MHTLLLLAVGNNRFACLTFCTFTKLYGEQEVLRISRRVVSPCNSFYVRNWPAMPPYCLSLVCLAFSCSPSHRRFFPQRHPPTTGGYSHSSTSLRRCHRHIRSSEKQTFFHCHHFSTPTSISTPCCRLQHAQCSHCGSPTRLPSINCPCPPPKHHTSRPCIQSSSPSHPI